MPQTISLALLHALRNRGAKLAFGIPGDFVLPFFKVIEESEILPYYTLSHEPGVGYAADAAARMNSGLAVAVVTYGAGALNMVNAVAQAYAEKSPLVVISGAPGIGEGNLGLKLHHQVKNLGSQFEIFRELTCDQACLNDPATAHREIARVLDSAINLSRPVYIEFPRDLVDAPCEKVAPFKPFTVDQDAVAACAAEIMARLRSAERPALLAGVEVRRYGLEEKTARLARSLGLPTATSFMGRGLLAKRDCPLIGTYMGLAGDSRVSQTIEGADSLLMMGVIMSDTNFGVSGRNIDMRQAIQAVDGEVRFAHHMYPGVTLEALVHALQAIAEPVADATREGCTAYPRGLVADEAAVTPSDIAMGVNDLFAERAPMPIASDIGDCLFTAMEIENTELIAPGYYASMGLGVPAGLAIEAASGRRPMILVGDGAFQMTGWEIGHCRKYGWKPIVLLFNNKSWEMLRTFQPGPGYHDLDDWHFAEIAKTLGGRGHRVTTRAGLREALFGAYDDPDHFHLVEVMLERGQTSKTLSRFAGAIRELSVLGRE